MLSDKEIVELILTPPSKEKGVKLLYEKYREVFINHYRRFVKPKEDTEDLYQDCVLDLIYKMIVKHKFDSEKGSLKNLIFTIGKNRLLNRNRKRKVDLIFVDEWQKLDYIQEKPNYAPQVNPLLAQVKGCLYHLKEKEQRIIDLFYVKRYSMEDIALEMGYASINAAKMAKHRAFKNLLQLIHSTNN